MCSNLVHTTQDSYPLRQTLIGRDFWNYRNHELKSFWWTLYHLHLICITFVNTLNVYESDIKCKSIWMSTWVIRLGPNQLGHESLRKWSLTSVNQYGLLAGYIGAKLLRQYSFNTLVVTLRPDHENPEYVLKKSNTFAKDIRQYFVLFVQKFIISKPKYWFSLGELYRIAGTLKNIFLPSWLTWILDFNCFAD